MANFIFEFSLLQDVVSWIRKVRSCNITNSKIVFNTVKCNIVYISFLAILASCNTELVCDIGGACDDDNPLTEQDVLNSNCECIGTIICTPGWACNDGDNTTFNDTFDDDCNCLGTATTCTGVGDADGDGLCADIDCDDNDPLNTDHPGKACDDHEVNTGDDTINADCICVGEIICASLGDQCDDGDHETYNDTINLDCNCVGEPLGSFIDPRDGQEYNTFEIDNEGATQTWFTQNLNYDTTTAWCYNNDPQMCEQYGRLYDWHTAMRVCPEGWSLPTDLHYRHLVNIWHGDELAGGHMKEQGTQNWEPPNLGATNLSGFTGLPGGMFFNEQYTGERLIGRWWTRTQDGAYGGIWAAICYSLYYIDESVEHTEYFKEDGYSVRCMTE